jgi:RNA polymerase sigma-70 factor (ECF subfamily)
MNISVLNDNELVTRYVNGDEAALKALITRHQRRLFSYIMSSVKNRELAEDIFQETFIKVVNTLRSGNYKEEGKFLSWIMRIANNLKIDHFRRNQRMPIYDNDGSYDIFDMVQDSDLSVEQKIITGQIHEDISRLVKHLPEEQREVLEMRIYQDISFKEIAEKTNVSINTALGRMRYALINIRRMIKENNLVIN